MNSVAQLANCRLPDSVPRTGLDSRRPSYRLPDLFVRALIPVAGSNLRKLCAVFIGLVSGSVHAQTTSITLAWDPPAFHTDGTDLGPLSLAGYRIYHGLSSGNYNAVISVANQLMHTVEGLDADSTYYFAVSAVDTNGAESVRSEELVWESIVSAPVIFPRGGTYNNAIMVRLFSTMPGTEIRYTLDGTHPELTSALYSQPIWVNESTTVKAIGFRTGSMPSVAVVENILIEPDFISPSVTTAYVDNDPSYVYVRFSEPVDRATAEQTVNYSIVFGGVTITSAKLLSDEQTVVLMTSPLTEGYLYFLFVQGVTDLSASANPTDFSVHVAIQYDPRPPEVVAAVMGSDPTFVSVLFSEPVELASAEIEANYGIFFGGILVTSAVLQADARIVKLGSSPLRDGVTYHLVARNVNDLAVPPLAIENTSSVMIERDLAAPAVESVTIDEGRTRVDIRFSERVEMTSAENIFNYGIFGGVTLTSARLQADGITVSLTTSPLSYGPLYILVVHGIKDLTLPPNTIPAGTRIPFN